MIGKVNFTCGCNPIRGALVALLIGCIVPTFGQWEQLNSGTSDNLRSIWFQNSQVGFCAGGGDYWGVPDGIGVVLKTTNSGESWVETYSLPGVTFFEVVAYDDTVICYGRGDGSPNLLLQSFNSGATWQLDTIAEMMSMMTVEQGVVRFVDGAGNLHEWRGGMDSIIQSGGIYTYSVTGEAYTMAIPGAPGILIQYSDGLDGLWSESNLDRILTSSTNFALIQRSGDTIAFKTTYPAMTWFTFDGGENWNHNEGGPDFVGAMPEPKVQYGSGSGIFYTADFGASWQMQDSTTVPMQQFHFLNDSVGYVCGYQGSILRTTNGGVATGMAEQIPTPSLISVSPNPASGNFTLLVPDGVQVNEITLLDSAMKRVKTFPSSTRVLDISGIPSGTYLLQVYIGQGMQTIRLILPGTQ